MKVSPIAKEWMMRPSMILILMYLINNGNCYLSKISRRVYITERCLWENLIYLTEKKIVYTNKEKGKRYIYLTEKGKEIAKKLNELDILFKHL